MQNLINQLIAMSIVTIAFFILWLRPDLLQKLFSLIRRQIARLFGKKKVIDKSPLSIAVDPVYDHPKIAYIADIKKPSPLMDSVFYFHRGGKLKSQAKKRLLLRRANINQSKK